MKLREYVAGQGGQTKFAEVIGVSQGLVWQWINGKTRITAERCLEIEQKTAGKLSRRDLRPDLFELPPHSKEQEAA